MTREREAELGLRRAERALELANKQFERITTLLLDAKDRVRLAREQARLGGRGKQARLQRARQRADKLLQRQREAREKRTEAQKSLRKLRQQRREEIRADAARQRFIDRLTRMWDRSAATEIRQSGSVITGEQLRAARAVLDLSRKELAEWLDLPVNASRHLEQTTGRVALDARTARKISKRLRAAGIELIAKGFYAGDGGPGIRIRPARERQPASRPLKAQRTGQAAAKRRRNTVAA